VIIPELGVALTCPNVDALLGLTPGRHELEVRLALFDDEPNITTTPLLSDRVVWEVFSAQ
jgi:hypothetical protein